MAITARIQITRSARRTALRAARQERCASATRSSTAVGMARPRSTSTALEIAESSRPGNLGVATRAKTCGAARSPLPVRDRAVVHPCRLADGVLVARVAGLLELEGAVSDIKAAHKTLLQLIEQCRKVAVAEARVVDDDVGTEHR